jgi:hypothetical protein
LLAIPEPPATTAALPLVVANVAPMPAPAFGFDLTMICPEIVTLPVARMMVPLGTVSVPLTVKEVN